MRDAFFLERVAGAAHGSDEVRLAVGVERTAQATDVDVDGAKLDIDVLAPDGV